MLDVARAIELGLLIEMVVEADETPTPDEDSKCYSKLLVLLPRSQRNVGQREVLRYIQSYPAAVTVAEIADHFGETTSTIVGILNGGLQRNIKKAGFTRVDDVLKIVKEAGVWRYYPSDLLLRQPPVPS